MIEIMIKSVLLALLSFLLPWVCFRVDASAAMVYRPMNLVVRSGKSLELSCLWNENVTSPGELNTIEWYHTPVGSGSLERKINHGSTIVNPIFNGSSTLNGNVTGQRLKVAHAQIQHAGLYTCTSMVQEQNDRMVIKKAAAHVVFLDADPVCEMRSDAIQKENGLFEICCMASYTGSLLPTMKWRMANGDNRSKERAMNVTPLITENRAISALTIVADSTLNGTRFICETVFEVAPTESNRNEEVADNTPNYNYTWKSSYIQVLYGPRNLRVIPAGDVFYPQDNLTCVADGNPKPKVVWVNLDSNAVTHGPTVTIDEEMIRDEPYRFMCRATNPSMNHTQEVTTGFTVKRRCLSNDSTVLLLKVLLAVTLGVSAVIIASLSLYITKTKSKRRDISSAVSIAEGKPCNAVNTKVPLSRVSRHNLSSPLPTTDYTCKPFDDTDYLSPQELPPARQSAYYDVIPYAQAVSVQNAVYLDLAPESSNQPTALESSRPVNEYQPSAELNAQSKAYETLQKRE